MLHRMLYKQGFFDERVCYYFLMYLLAPSFSDIKSDILLTDDDVHIDSSVSYIWTQGYVHAER